jgi:UDP-N-acetylglucosamine--N-acetylmuramyl-(pentapeptide) pyrophosphoryl-undecaprenol N-acetylglucosamine transferase
MTIAIAAAGTGGHVFPALAVAEALQKLGTASEDIFFLGGNRIEATAVPQAGYELVRVELRGFVRKLSFQNLRVMADVLSATRLIRRQLSDRGVTAVLAMGGYVTGPAALAARWERVPLFLHEQNAVPGLANRLAGRLARRVFVAFPAAARVLPRAEVVGNPIRAALMAGPPDAGAARSRYGLDPERPVVGVLGGSQGADALNQAARRLVDSAPPYQVLHLAGGDQHQPWSDLAQDKSGWAVVPFESDMRFFFAAADLVVARAGALTVSELAVTGTPSILVPYPGASGHQTANAAFLAEAGGATVVPQPDLARLGQEVSRALIPAELARRGAAAAAVGRPDAAGRVAARVREATGD